MTAHVLAERIGAPADSKTVHREAGWITVIAGVLAALMARKAHARHAAEALARLNDHVLQDIGLTRAEVLHTILADRRGVQARGLSRLRPRGPSGSGRRCARR